MSGDIIKVNYHPVPITCKMTKEMIAEMDRVVAMKWYNSRSEFIRQAIGDAIEFIFSTESAIEENDKTSLSLSSD